MESIYCCQAEQSNQRVSQHDIPLKHIFSYNLKSPEITINCKHKPTDTIRSRRDWLLAYSNKYNDEVLNGAKVGKWNLFWSRGKIDDAWENIKMGITKGQLWMCEVTSAPNSNFITLIYTKDYTDVEDVIQCMDLLESSGLKAREEVVVYDIDDDDYTEWIYVSHTIRTSLDCHSIDGYNITPSKDLQARINHLLIYDLHQQKTLRNCRHRASEVLELKSACLVACNNKHAKNEISERRIGNWIVVVSKVDHAWELVKGAIKNGNLWYCRVFKLAPSPLYVIEVATKNFADLADVIQCLNYLERSGLTPINENMPYRTNYQVCNKTSLIYSSKSIRNPIYCQIIDDLGIELSKNLLKRTESVIHEFSYDLNEGRVVVGCGHRPTQISCPTSSCLFARNNKYVNEALNAEKKGKWMLFFDGNQIDSTWNRIKEAITTGDLWHAKVAVSKTDTHYAVMIYTKDYTDIDDVKKCLQFLETSGLKPETLTVKYKTDKQTKAGHYSWAGFKKPWIYCSSSIMNITEEAKCTNHYFSYDLNENITLLDCQHLPSKVPTALWAKNNKYRPNIVDYKDKTGGWKFSATKQNVNDLWDELKKAVRNGDIWSCKVALNKNSFYDVVVYTYNCYNIDDATSCLEFLEKSRIKPHGEVIEYIASGQLKNDTQVMYRSDTITTGTLSWRRRN